MRFIQKNNKMEPELDLYFLNFKKAIVILTDKDMRANIIKIIEENDVSVDIKYVNSYIEAAEIINTEKFDPYDHIILNSSKSNKKLKDFMEFIEPTIEKNSSFLIKYNSDGTISI